MHPGTIFFEMKLVTGKTKQTTITGFGNSGLIFLAPAMVMLGMFFILPLLGVIYLSFQEW